MAVYSKIIDDHSIIKAINNHEKNILIIGCGGCINESLAYTNERPIFKAPEGKMLTEEPYPYAVHVELIRLKALLEQEGFNAKCFESYELRDEGCDEGFLCIRKSGISFDLIGKFKEFKIDKILTVCCGAGTYGIKDDYGKNIPVYQITKPFGMIAYSYKDVDNARYIDYEHSKLIGKNI